MNRRSGDQIGGLSTLIWQHSAGVIPFRKSRTRRYLLLKSGLTKSELWEFPKGLIEKGEDALTAASREFEEETGIADWQLVPGFKQVLKYFYRAEKGLVAKTVTYFLGQVISPESDVRISSESLDFVWLTRKQAEKKIRHKNLLKLLDSADRFLNNA